jgi:hypothetical protein
MKPYLENMVRPVALFLLLLMMNTCVTEFVPDLEEDEQLLVVQGMITDQPETDTIFLSRSLPLGPKKDAVPVTRYIVRITDDLGNTQVLQEAKPGAYITDPAKFRGEIGRSYRLRINTNTGISSKHYESEMMQIKPVPPVDSVYYEKTVIKPDFEGLFGIDGCQIYLDTHDPANECNYYRWDFSETWILRLLFGVPNQTCYVSDRSGSINIKSTASFGQSIVKRQPITFINNETDRLQRRYSIEVSQYSLNEDEYNFWERLQNVTDEVGGLYDIIPSTIPSNLKCLEDQEEKVLGYFSVSAKTTKRIFITDEFNGIIYRYGDCATDTVYGEGDIPGIDSLVWTIWDFPAGRSPRVRVLTDRRGCADCTVRGTKEKPAFWIDQ